MCSRRNASSWRIPATACVRPRRPVRRVWDFITRIPGNQDLSLADLVTEGFEEVDYDFVKRLHHRVHDLPVTIAQTEVPETDI